MPVTNIPMMKFNNGLEIPSFGFGTWQGKPGSNQEYEAVLAAIDAGYRHFDTAAIYGTERETGRAIIDKMNEGVIKRKDVFITTKLWKTHLEPDIVIKACRESSDRLHLHYIDLFIIHFPCAFKNPNKDPEYLTIEGELCNVNLEDTWRSMEKCVEMGLTRSIGLSNFNSQQIQRILNCAKIKPVNLQIEIHPYLNQKKLINYCNQNDIIVTAYSPLGASWMEGHPNVLGDPVLAEISKKYKKTPAQISLRYLIQSGVIPIPKSSSAKRLQENIDVFDFTLDQSDVDKIDMLNKNGQGRVCTFIADKDHPEYPFKPEIEF